MDRVVAYVDGFNLYFGLKAEHGRRYLWLDLQALVEGLLLPNQELREVQYFTARVRDDPYGERRQAAYLDALACHCQKVRRIDGRFQEKTRGCKNCGARWTSYDVNISVALIEGAALDAYDTALLISGDTDLRPAIASVKRLQPDKLVFAAFPPRRYSARLVQSVDAYTRIGHDKIRNAQLPHEVVTKGGVRLNRPAYWS
jgi:uncharacterized LabA/DUF88 family protein